MGRFRTKKSDALVGNANAHSRASAATSQENDGDETEKLRKQVTRLKRCVDELRKTCDAQATDLEQAEFERKRLVKKCSRRIRESAPEDPDQKQPKPRAFKTEAAATVKAELQRLKRKGEHFERILKGLESATTVSEAIHSYSNLTSLDKAALKELPLHAEMLLGYLR
ncbi:hypothetical protein CYMTET_34058 [Cymbomonas tetramitiformis]|uniref:Uncharacterized protein n=1 Tax=Cymbomonas tetramitiformis TaxID=36881 RepID=A0AAE0FCF6_9CHLO|nr:hypothetical protein CYMTET_34058 [Cymbomonas tetramitiformis]